jgi:uncharacterized RmlC-like cupin family protein
LDDGVRMITPDQRTEGAGTSGMVREEAVATEGMWAGVARTEPRMVSGWHHHGDYESAIYVLTGGLRMEFGPDGAEVLDATPGDFVYVAPGAVHRESNPTGPMLIFIPGTSGSSAQMGSMFA